MFFTTSSSLATGLSLLILTLQNIRRFVLSYSGVFRESLVDCETKLKQKKKSRHRWRVRTTSSSRPRPALPALAQTQPSTSSLAALQRAAFELSCVLFCCGGMRCSYLVNTYKTRCATSFPRRTNFIEFYRISLKNNCECLNTTEVGLY